jgi:hypothetical protein
MTHPDEASAILMTDVSFGISQHGVKTESSIKGVVKTPHYYEWCQSLNCELKHLIVENNGDIQPLLTSRDFFLSEIRLFLLTIKRY